MPTTITQALSSLGTPPTTADPATFDARGDTMFGTSLPRMVTELTTWQSQANTVASEVNASAVSTAANAVTATAASVAALAAANYKGAWSSLTGGLNIPASVSHAGAIWCLVSSLADVTLQTPSATNAFWTRIDASTGYSWSIIADAASLTLPALNTLPTRPHIIAPTSATTVPTNLTTSNGWRIPTGFVAGTLSIHAPVATPNAHGVWPTGIAVLPPLLGTSPLTGTTVKGTVQLDTNLVAVLYSVPGGTVRAEVINTATGAVTAVPANIAALNADNAVGIFKTSTTGFVVSCQSAAGAVTWRACSVDAGTLAITMGAAAVTAVAAHAQTPVQLSASRYVFRQNNASGIVGVNVTGLVVTIGAAVASGSDTDATSTNCRLARFSATEFCAVIVTTGGATAATRGLAALVGSVSAAGVVALNASVASAAGNIFSGGTILALLPFVEGTSYFTSIGLGALATTGCFQAVTFVGTVPTFGATTQRASDVPSTSGTNEGTWISKLSGTPAMRYDSTTVLMGHLAAGPYAVTHAAGALTFGATLALGAAKTFVRDVATGVNLYSLSAGVFDKLTVTGATLASSWQVAATPTVVVSDTLTDKAVSYAGTWYAWTINPNAILSSTVWYVPSTGTSQLISGPVA